MKLSTGQENFKDVVMGDLSRFFRFSCDRQKLLVYSTPVEKFVSQVVTWPAATREVLISFPDLLWTQPKARSGQIPFALRDHLSGTWQERQVGMSNKFRAAKADFVTYNKLTTGLTWEYSLESLNFIAFTKPNKHKMRSKGFFYNLAGFVFE